jgi:hypothetical protein
VNEIYSKAEDVTGTVQIWAVPRNHWEDTGPPFTYRLGESYRVGEVMVCEHEITLAVPAGINLIGKAVETLENKRKAAFEKYCELAKELQEKINYLLLLGGPLPDDTAIEGTAEVLEPQTD